MLSLPSADEDTPYRDLTDQIIKCEAYFAYGGFSNIHRGEWTDPLSDTTRTVAVKCLRSIPTDVEAEVTRRRLNRESRVWHGLDHPNVQPFLGVCRFGEIISIVSPLCEFGDAIKYFQKNPGADRLKAVCGAAKGLEYLHSLKVPCAVVHGDLKASNVLIDNDGVARLCDFGRAKLVGHRGFTTIFSGSMAYLAPELLAGAGPADEEETMENESFVPMLTKESDVYGFSMVALEAPTTSQILSSRAPFHYFQPESLVIIKVASGVKPWRNRHRSQALTDDLWSLLSGCWDHRPESRLDMGTVVEHLTRAQAVLSSA